MRGHPGTRRLVVLALSGLIASVPLLIGQGCFNTTSIIPTTGSLGGTTTGGVGGNVAPTLRFTAPLGDVQAEIGDNVLVTWVDSDPDNDARITLLLDPDATPNNGNEIPLVTGISEDDPTNAYTIATGAFGLTTGSYQIIARISDGINPELIVSATGMLNLFEPGVTPGNVSPTIVVTQPTLTLSVADGSTVDITYCGNDRDDGQGGVIADVILFLDNDDNPLNDLFAGLDLTSATTAQMISDLCTGTLPQAVTGGVVVGCAKDDKCLNPLAGTTFTLTVDATRIPKRADGEPYRVRATMWDHTNPPISAYARGTLSLTSFASGTVDLARVGRQTTGARFIGFDVGARAGFTGTTLQDFDGDGADDFIVVARFGRPYERGNVGSAYLVYGEPGLRFGSDIFLNSFGAEYRGCGFASGRTKVGSFILEGGDQYAVAADFSETPVTEGIVAVSYIEDLTGDGRPEILFGLPYVEQMYDYYDDDPCDEDGVCYFDGFPNQFSTADPGNDDIGAFDVKEGIVTIGGFQYFCSNDNDLFQITPINQGYMIYVTSQNPLEDTVIDITLAGQRDPGSLILEERTIVPGATAPIGARLRGGYYTGEFSDPTQSFGAALGSMPDLGDGGTIPQKDGSPEFLLSLPGAFADQGAVLLIWGQDLATFCTQPVQSIPDLRKVGDCFRSDMVPDDRAIYGANPGDEFGYANRAGDFNRDGHQDILCGAPGANNGTAMEAGIVYIIFGRLDFGDGVLLGTEFVPRIEIRGTVTGDRFGETQTMLGDVNNDGFQDVAFASRMADGPGGVDCGQIGIVFGGRRLTGENVFSVTQVGTSQLPGAVFYGPQPGGHAGTIIADAGDFNHDGFDDLLICAPDETRTVGQQTRRGVAYLVFGGPHLSGGFFSLGDVGTAALPGIVFVSPYAAGTADEATIDWVGAAGDVDGDGFADILIGVSQADFVNPR
ncbi:MAG: FG-GAP repeat protein, partial [Planctomycetes bacterium]|nr:FG-GAP repeat protein [Planctomycetota bacterium]